MIENASKRSSLQISAISVWEIGMLEVKGRINFEIDCMEWINRALNVPGISLVPLTPEIAISSSRLPGDFHGDPADRIIVATARKTGALLITNDNQILTYGKQNYLKVLSI
jgi:PIN domain nuclease of toxin-antitoxin system